MENTDAESVDDMVAASSKEGMSAKCMLVHDMPESHQMNSPVNRVVSRTPTEKDNAQSDGADKLGGVHVMKLNAKPVTAEKHPHEEEQQKSGHAKAIPRLASQYADKQKCRADKEYIFYRYVHLYQ